MFNITTTTAKYDAQNKSHIDDIDTTIINSVLSGDFATWLLNNKADAKAIVENALIERKARENAQKARDKTREVANGKGAKSIFADLPTKLSDAYPRNKKDRSNCELFICEGDSAGSSIKGVKNSEFQAVMPIRGKILNCLKEKDIAKIYGNAEVAGIVKALGLDVNPKTHRLIFNESKLRYSKIIIATDADADGSDISSLLLTVFDFLCPELIEKGYIYRVYGALFKAIFNDNTYVLLQNDADLEAWKKKNKKPYTLTRAKGLGELTAEETEEQLVNPMTRNLKRLKVDNYDEFKKYLLIYKGDAKEDKEARKDYYNKLVGGND